MVGKAAAEHFLAWRGKDNFDAKAEDKPGTGAGVWQRTPPGFESGVLPQFGGVTPFLLESVDQYVAKRPELTSASFARDLDEIRRLGGAAVASAPRTKPPRPLSGPATNCSSSTRWCARFRTRRGSRLWTTARVFALVHTAAADALIVSFRIKYRENAWRPITAIRAGSGEACGVTALRLADVVGEDERIARRDCESVPYRAVESSSPLRGLASPVISLAEQRLRGSIECLHGILDDALTFDVGDQLISAS